MIWSSCRHSEGSCAIILRQALSPYFLTLHLITKFFNCWLPNIGQVKSLLPHMNFSCLSIGCLELSWIIVRLGNHRAWEHPTRQRHMRSQNISHHPTNPDHLLSLGLPMMITARRLQEGSRVSHHPWYRYVYLNWGLNPFADGRILQDEKRSFIPAPVRVLSLWVIQLVFFCIRPRDLTVCASHTNNTTEQSRWVRQLKKKSQESRKIQFIVLWVPWPSMFLNRLRILGFFQDPLRAAASVIIAR